jgi:hypothetical protein
MSWFVMFLPWSIQDDCWQQRNPTQQHCGDVQTVIFNLLFIDGITILK